MEIHAEKPVGYYTAERPDLIAELPLPLGNVLDVGCGQGLIGAALKRLGADEVWGIELQPSAAEKARQNLDNVICGGIDSVLRDEVISERFDTICCYDILEHLVDPESVLRSLRELASETGRLHISIPNARHFSLIGDLVFRGTFGYREYGHRDNTHLRWYTRQDLKTLLERSGWSVAWIKSPVFKGRDRYVDRVTRGRMREFISLQWHAFATAS